MRCKELKLGIQAGHALLQQHKKYNACVVPCPVPQTELQQESIHVR
jgi:hypothetical protein